MEEAHWLFQVKSEAAIMYFHSPYPEVRSVTSPHDDPNTPCETLRSYFLGMLFMGASTAINTFFYPRQPSINLGPNVLQILLVPCGWFLARVLPDRGFTLFGSRHSLNPGPWSFKEQVFCSILFDITDGFASVIDVFYVQKLPQYLKQDWVDFSYEILLALAVEFLGFGFAGLLRRFVVFPVDTIFPSVLPTLALSRALVVPETKKENIHGWKITRYRFFLMCGVAMYIWFWVPNFLFQALHAFNWMTWIAPQNLTLAIITGFYGGMGFNPLATFDWNVSGSGFLTTPFWSAMQTASGQVIAGLIMIGLYFSNTYWVGYMPINSNGAFDNTGVKYVANKIISNGQFDVAKYEKYSPPFYSASGVFTQGSWFAWVTLVVTYVTIRFWPGLKRAYKGMWRSLRHTESVYKGHNDAHTRMMRAYPEVPEWWFMVMLLIAFGFGVAAMEAWPTECPWWSILIVIAISSVILVPFTFILAQANVAVQSTGFYHILCGLIWKGQPQPLLLVSAFGINFTNGASSWIADLKMGHYAKLPPRALFRGQVIATLLHSFIFIGIVDWMLVAFDDGTLCTYANKEHFVCQTVNQLYTNTTEYGVFGTRNIFTLYPIMPYCFLLGAIVGITFATVQLQGHRIRDWCSRHWNPDKFERWDQKVFKRLSYLRGLNPAILWSGAHQWGGGTNLSWTINGLYLSFIFMFYIKRRFPEWWEKYNYLIESSFNVGVAFSGLTQELAFNFGKKAISLDWWGNTVSLAGMDYQLYNNNASLYTIPKPPGYFGPAKGQYPNKG